jgi:hypothetical protein
MRGNVNVIELLSGGDRRSLGSSGGLVSRVVQNPAVITELVELLSAGDPIVTMRAADVLEKAQRKLPPSVFNPFVASSSR